MQRRLNVAATYYMALVAWVLAQGFFRCAYSADHKITSTSQRELVIKNEHMEVVLDAQFPRVFEYHVRDRPKLLGAVPAERPTIKLNGTIYTPAEFEVSSHSGSKETSYRVTFAKLHLILDLDFRLEGDELRMNLVHVKDSGSFRLNSLYFPNHYLIRMPALTPGGTMYRGEYQMRPWKKPNLPGSYSDSIPHFGVIAEEDGEQSPMRVNWAAMYGSGLCATIANNLGAWKLASQFLGYSDQASDFAVWNWTYHYRIRGKLQPLLESRIAILTADVNNDAKVDWIEAALWQRKLFPAANPLYAGPTYVYKIIDAFGPPNNSPVTSFEECLPIIKSISEITGGLPQIVFLVGWQYEGHDTGYPSVDKVNPDLGGEEKLRWLAKEAKKYNALISYHINLDDAYREQPGWDPSVVSLRRDGKPYSRGFNGENNLQRYQISHTKEIESGYFQKRAQAFLDAVPVEKAVHFDTLECTGVSYGPGEDIGADDELEACKEIFKWFSDRGIDVSSESPFDRFYGTLSWFLHQEEMQDPFQLIMMHGKAYGGGKPRQPVNEVLGWSTGMPVMAHHSTAYPMYSTYSVNDTSDMFYLGTLLQYYLDKKELVFLGTEGDEYVARFDDGTISKQKEGGPLSVKERGVVIADGQDRFVPLNDSEIRLYSVSGGVRIWTLPSRWANAKVTLSALGAEGVHEIKEFKIDNNRLELTMDPHRPYVLRRK